ncbi:hypothetical protein E2K93_00680 [Thalassotalea sp. HSM 43]|uniref:hypothetical protein n=1 Tax=Thalassotalea sp. HSM 43 TaxID=2552945 RepID=UPI001081E18E|nr:hypothetical protein [Thalassotalea sp. HSM 43]QBY02974.1 hypothetical protein E2K93_00680 [Thalassotalea sp. HSM 43]
MANFPVCKAIYCYLPDDGTDKRLLAELREKFGVTSAGSSACRGIGALAEVKTKQGKLPESELVKILFITCAEEQAKDIFDFIFWFAEVDKPGRGVVWQQRITSCTPYELPTDVADEETGA